MASKANFSPDEWSRIVASVMVTGMAVSAADPSGLWGLMKEGMAGGRGMLEAHKDPQANELVKALVNDVATPATREATRSALQTKFKVKQVSEIKSKAIEELRAVSGLIDGKAPEDAAAFKIWLLGIAQKTAEAATEGGFLGFGGVAVSQTETATLKEIEAPLNIRPTTV